MHKEHHKPKNEKNPGFAYDFTDETIVGSGGLPAFVRFLRQMGLREVVANKWVPLHKKNRKGLSPDEIVEQLIAYIACGGRKSLEGLQEWSDGESLREVLGWRKRISPDSVARLLKGVKDYRAFENLVNELLRRMVVAIGQEEGWDYIEVAADTKVLAQPYAKKREGVTATYRDTRGYHPLYVMVNGYIAGVRFRPGNQHGNYGNEVDELVKELVIALRRGLGEKVTLVVRMDSGFMDGELFALLDSLDVYFAIGGRCTAEVKARATELMAREVVWMRVHREVSPMEITIEGANGEVWHDHCEGRLAYEVAVMTHKAKVWKKAYPLLVTWLSFLDERFNMYKEETQKVIYTNMDAENVPVALRDHYEASGESWMLSVTRFYHYRGEDELLFRRFVEIWKESLPFLSFSANGVFFCILVLTYNLLSLFERKVVAPLRVERGSLGSEGRTYREPLCVRCRKHVYLVPKRKKKGREASSTPRMSPTMLRECFFRIPAKIVRSGRQWRVKVPRFAYRLYRFYEILSFIQHQPPLFLRS